CRSGPVRDVGPAGSEAEGAGRRADRGLLSARRQVAVRRGGCAASRARGRSPEHARASGRNGAPFHFRSNRLSIRVGISEGAGSWPLEPGRRAELFRTLLEKGYTVSSVRDIPAGAETVVLGRFDQPATGSMHDIDGLDASAVLGMVDAVREQAGMPVPGKWKPWFPVIDYQRCTNCMQCLSFCLFDGYGVGSDGKIQVQNQSNCKTDCPACSRVCPEVAILFPKYRHGPIHGGEINQDDLRREAMKVDISALLGGDIYSMLRDRSA